MPFYKQIEINASTKIFLWKITETFDELFKSVALRDTSLFRLEKMKSESHQKGFLAVRMLLQYLGYNDFNLEYDNSGKPHLSTDDGILMMDDKCATNNTQHKSPISHHISISHSGEFSAIAISNEKIGIDLEKTKEKVLRIAPRFMDVTHLENLSIEDQIKKATIIWGVKESIFKIKNEVGISFPDHIFENKFSIADKYCTAQLQFNNRTQDFSIVFDFIEDYALVCAFNKK